MSLTPEQVKKVAHLARIKIPAEKVEYFANSLNKIFAWIDKLSEVDTNNVEPLRSVHNINLPLREDAVTEKDNSKELVAHAPDSTYNYVSVPKVIE